MKKILSLSLVFVLLLSAFVLASCKGINDKDAQNTAPPPSAVSETAAPTEPTTTAPETEAPTADPNPRPDPVTIEWLAAEMQRRYYVGCMNLELMDYSDIMDRNEDTDLFFWDNQLQIDAILFSPNPDERAHTFKGTLHVSEIKSIVSESETEITADASVGLRFPGLDPDNPEDYSFIGHEFRITVDKQRMVIISYSEPDACTSRYTDRLLPLASNYRKEGLTWQEADKKAYEELYAELAN